MRLTDEYLIGYMKTCVQRSKHERTLDGRNPGLREKRWRHTGMGIDIHRASLFPAVRSFEVILRTHFLILSCVVLVVSAFFLD